VRVLLNITRIDRLPPVLLVFSAALGMLAFEQGAHVVVPREVTLSSGGTTFHRITMMHWQTTTVLAALVAGIAVLARGGGAGALRWRWSFLVALVTVIWMLVVLGGYASDSTPNPDELLGRFGPRYVRDEWTSFNGAYHVGFAPPPTNEEPFWWHDSRWIVRARVDPIWDAMLILWLALVVYLLCVGSLLVGRSAIESTSHCAKCGYDRAGLAVDSPCPECGEPAPKLANRNPKSTIP
jgi:hypothetical protein